MPIRRSRRVSCDIRTFTGSDAGGDDAHHNILPSRPPDRERLMIVRSVRAGSWRKDLIMESRFDLIQHEVGRKLVKRLFAVNQLVEEGTLPKVLRELVSLRASQINGCAPCVDIHTKEAAAAGETQLRLNLITVWRETELFTDAERAALALAEEGTRIADAATGVSDETWAAVRRHYTDDQIAALIILVGLANAVNRMNVITRAKGGNYDPSMIAALAN